MYRIITQLEENHKIWGYSGITDEKSELQKFILFLKRGKGINESQHFRQLIETQMDTLKEDLGISVLHSYFIHGEYDLLTVFTAKDIMTAKKFITALLDKFPVTQKIRINQVLYKLREQYILTPHPEEVKDFV